MSTPAVISSAPRSGIIRPGQSLVYVDDHPSEPGSGVRVAPVLGAEHGANHLAVALVELAPGGWISGQRHPFEESFFVLDGNPLVAVANKSYALGPHDFGLVPFATAHAWSNPGRTPARLLRVHAPQPRPVDGRGDWGVFEATDVAVPEEGEVPDESDPARPFVGHFDEIDMAPPGSISMPGYHGTNVQNVQIRMMVDELLGARQQAMFVVQFRGGHNAKAAREHFHPFEEIFYLLSGSTMVSFDGTTQVASAGDLVFAPVGASHGFSPVGEGPVRWIEVQSPLPPASDGFVFHNDWAAHRNVG